MAFRVAVVAVAVAAVVVGGDFVVPGVYRPHLPGPKYSNPRTQKHINLARNY
jgi:hypothetical protein